MIHVQSHLSPRDQVRTPGAAWLDQQLLSGKTLPALNGFGGELRRAMEARLEFLVESGFASRPESGIDISDERQPLGRPQRILCVRNV